MFEESSSAIPSIWESMNSWFTPTVLFVLLNVVIGTIAFTSTLTNPQQNQHQQGEDSQNDHPQQNQHQQGENSQNDPQQQTIDRSPSVLHRLKSFNFYRSQNSKEKTVTDGESDMETETHNFEAHSQYFFQHPSDQESFQENLEAKDERSQTQHEIFQQDLNFEEEKVTHFDFEQAQEEKADKIELQRMDEVDGEAKDSHHHVTRTKSDTEPASGEIPVKLPARIRKSASLKLAFGHFEEDNVEARRPQTAREKGNKKLTEDDEVDSKADDFINKFKNQLKLQRLDSDIRYNDMRTGK